MKSPDAYADETPERMEAWAGLLLVEAARKRLARSGPNDAHELRHLLAAVEAGNSDPCGPNGEACSLDRLGLSLERDAQPGTFVDTCSECGARIIWHPGVGDEPGQWVPQPAPRGWWAVSENDLSKFTPEAAEAMQDALRRASFGGKTIVTIDGITLRWHDFQPAPDALRAAAQAMLGHHDDLTSVDGCPSIRCNEAARLRNALGPKP